MSSNKDVYVPPPRFVLGHAPTEGAGVYKVLCLTYRIESPDQTICGQACSVLTLDDSGRRWRARPDAPAPAAPAPHRVALIRGVVAYFLVMKSDICIASFDFAAEEWTRIIQGPPVVSSQKIVRHYAMFMLAAFSDCLVAVHNNLRGMSVDLWFMDDMEHSLDHKILRPSGTCWVQSSSSVVPIFCSAGDFR
jgi:F-box interacting protein